MRPLSSVNFESNAEDFRFYWVFWPFLMFYFLQTSSNANNFIFGTQPLNNVSFIVQKDQGQRVITTLQRLSFMTKNFTSFFYVSSALSTNVFDVHTFRADQPQAINVSEEFTPTNFVYKNIIGLVTNRPLIIHVIHEMMYISWQCQRQGDRRFCLAGCSESGRKLAS